MTIPLRYNVLSLFRRKVSTFMTAGGIALVVAVFIITMSLSQGIRDALGASGVALNLIVMRQSSTAETTSFVSRNAYQIVRHLDGIVKMDRDVALAKAEVRPIAFSDSIVSLVAPETLVLATLAKKGDLAPTNVIIRGITSTSFLVHPEIRLVEGRSFKPGLREIIVSRSLANRYQNCAVGDSLRFGKGLWRVVGHFDAGASAFNSEIWADVYEIGGDFDRQQFSSITVRVVDEGAGAALTKRLSEDPQLSLVAKPEVQYYKEQTRSALPIQILGTFMATVMAIGACFAAMNTMYAAVSSRSKEIGTLRVLGFGPGEILRSFLFESVLLSLIGGALGCALSYPLNGLATSTANFSTFSELSFRFSITPRLLLLGMLFSLVMGVLGGWAPARRAARRQVIAAIKEL
ncbi:ABC transporter permease [candidate division BRC1 bacterium HGW-BRC1-1]|nr:MAG: ABC transporter permease [candidate division BRC1 bacterium HGW-BRC1-1]